VCKDNSRSQKCNNINLSSKYTITIVIKIQEQPQRRLQQQQLPPPHLLIQL
jgi:hypothetical protein